MTASAKWINAAAEILIHELGADRAFKIVNKLYKMPGSNLSARQTLSALLRRIAAEQRKEATQ